MKPILEVNDLHKAYGDHEVIKGITFAVMPGEVFALLGTNGAGKTTTLECIENLRAFQKGTIRVNGVMGVQLQSSSLPPDMKVIEAMKLFSKWRKCEVNENLLHQLGLSSLLQQEYKSLSTGQKRRLHLAMAMISNPDIIFLDEPTAGLDVEGRVALHEEIRHLKQQGKTMIMASHDMAEVEELCDRIAILKDGKLAFCGSVGELKNQIKDCYRVHLRLSERVMFTDMKKGVFLQEDKGYAIFECACLEDFLEEVITVCHKKQIHLQDIQVEQASLEQRFIQIAREN